MAEPGDIDADAGVATSPGTALVLGGGDDIKDGVDVAGAALAASEAAGAIGCDFAAVSAAAEDAVLEFDDAAAAPIAAFGACVDGGVAATRVAPSFNTESLPISAGDPPAHDSFAVAGEVSAAASVRFSRKTGGQITVARQIEEIYCACLPFDIESKTDIHVDIAEWTRGRLLGITRGALQVRRRAEG